MLPATAEAPFFDDDLAIFSLALVNGLAFATAGVGAFTFLVMMVVMMMVMTVMVASATVGKCCPAHGHNDDQDNRKDEPDAVLDRRPYLGICRRTRKNQGYHDANSLLFPAVPTCSSSISVSGAIFSRCIRYRRAWRLSFNCSAVLLKL